MTILWPCYLTALIPEVLNVVYYFNDLDLVGLTSFMVSFVITMCLIIIDCFSDNTGIDLHDLRKMSPKDLASFASCLVFGWFEPFVIKGYKNVLTQKDLAPAPDYVNVSNNVQSFMKYFNEYVQKHQIDFIDKKSQQKRLNILVPLLKSFGWRFLAANLCAFIGFAWQFSNPMVSLGSSHIYLGSCISFLCVT